MKNIIDGIKIDTLNSAIEFQGIRLDEKMRHSQQIASAIVSENAKKTEVLLQGAQSSIEQKALLEQQLAEVKLQNAQLTENNSLLEKMYIDAKQDAIKNAKAAKNSRIFGWISLLVTTIIAILGFIV